MAESQIRSPVELRSTYCASRLHAKYVLHVPDPPIDYCFALEEVNFLEKLQTIESVQQSGHSINEKKHQQLLEV